VRLCLAAAAIASSCLLGLSCGSSKSTPTEPENPTLTNTITISSAGVSPQNIQVAAGTRVLFKNEDSRAHNMSSDPHPEHTDCPELNQVGLLSPGQSRETGNLNSVRTCRFHDHDNPNTTSLNGAIVIR
jgi:plastocyanin